MSHVLSSFGDSFLGGSSGTVALSHLIRVLFIGLELPHASEAVNRAETMEKDFPEATFLCKGLALPFFFSASFLAVAITTMSWQLRIGRGPLGIELN